MTKYLWLSLAVILLVSVESSNTIEYELPISQKIQERLSKSLEELVEELGYFRTPSEDKTRLYQKVAKTEQCLQETSDELYQYGNVILGQFNEVYGSKNVIVGNYNDIKGKNNFIFIEKYSGRANGDLLIGNWRIDIGLKKLIPTNSSLAISYINEEENRKYLRQLFSRRGFSLGSSQGQNVFTLIKKERGIRNYNDNYDFTSTTFKYTPNEEKEVQSESQQPIEESYDFHRQHNDEPASEDTSTVSIGENKPSRVPISRVLGVMISNEAVEQSQEVHQSSRSQVPHSRFQGSTLVPLQFVLQNQPSREFSSKRVPREFFDDEIDPTDSHIERNEEEASSREDPRYISQRSPSQNDEIFQNTNSNPEVEHVSYQPSIDQRELSQRASNIRSSSNTSAAHSY